MTVTVATKDDLERLRLQMEASMERSRNATIAAVVAFNALVFAALQLVS